jgi:hypothetical protein
MPWTSGQGTIEYLVIIGIVVVISLVVVGVMVGQTSSATNISTTSSKISSLVGEISLVDSGVTPDGNYMPQAFATIRDVDVIYTN